jgi:hypothetical protein
MHYNTRKYVHIILRVVCANGKYDHIRCLSVITAYNEAINL